MGDKGIEDDSEGFGLNLQKDGIVINSNRENCMEQSEKEDQELGLGHIIYKMCISHPDGDVKRLSEYTSLESRRENGLNI